MRDKLEIKDKINSFYNPNKARLSFLLRVLRLTTFLLIGLFLAYIKSHEQSSKGIMTICYEIFLSFNTLFSFSKGIIATLYLIKTKYQTILFVVGVAIGLEIFWYPFSNWLINQLTLLFNQTINLFKRKKSIFDDGARCVLLDGPWGSGKTTYYKNHIKPYFSSEPIYISCFSATRDQLITQLIIANPIFNLLSLHGVLSSLIKNSWQSFMPRNKIIVFDDLERLHKADDEAYRDLIGIIEYLKSDLTCKILLITNRVEISAKIFSIYLEKVYDDAVPDFDPRINLNKMFNKYKYKIPDDLDKKLKEVIIDSFSKLEYYNLRVIKNIYNKLCKELENIFKDNEIKVNKENDFIFYQFIDLVKRELTNYLKISALYFNDYDLYEKIRLGKSDDYQGKVSEYEQKLKDQFGLELTMIRQDLPKRPLLNNSIVPIFKEYVYTIFLQIENHPDFRLLYLVNKNKNRGDLSKLDRNRLLELEIVNNEEKFNEEKFNQLLENYNDPRNLDH